MNGNEYLPFLGVAAIKFAFYYRLFVPRILNAKLFLDAAISLLEYPRRPFVSFILSVRRGVYTHSIVSLYFSLQIFFFA